MQDGCRYSSGPRAETVDGAKTVKACMAAKGFQAPDLAEGIVDTPGCASLRPSHLEVTPLSALKNGESGDRASKMRLVRRMATVGMLFSARPTNGAPEQVPDLEMARSSLWLAWRSVAFHRSSLRNLVNSEVSMARVDLRYRVPYLDPCLHFVSRREVGATGAFTTHLDDILVCRELDVVSKTKVLWGRWRRGSSLARGQLEPKRWNCRGRRWRASVPKRPR